MILHHIYNKNFFSLSRNTFLVLVFLALSSQSENLLAEQGSNPSDTDILHLEQNSAIAWISEKRNYWGNLVGDAGRRLDGFFASDEVIERSNNSFVKFALRGTYSRGGRSRLDPLLKFRLDLPALKERLKIVFENEADETRSLAEKNLSQIDKETDKLSDNAVGAVKLTTKKDKKWGASTSVGIDIQIPPDYFWRGKTYYRWQISQKWQLDAQQKLYYFHKDGWGETTRLSFDRNGTSGVFRSTSEARYLHDERRMEFAQTWSFLKELDPIRAVNFRLGILGENKPTAQTTDYFTEVIYRRKLSKEWLFYEITPGLLFPRENSFKATPSITAKIEIVFSSS